MGIIIGALALFVVLSVFSGLKEFSLSFTNAMDPDLKLGSTLGKSIVITPEQERQMKQINGLVSYSKIIEERVLFTFDGKQEVTYLKGIDSLFTKVNPIEKNLLTDNGSLQTRIKWWWVTALPRNSLWDYWTSTDL